MSSRTVRLATGLPSNRKLDVYLRATFSRYLVRAFSEPGSLKSATVLDFEMIFASSFFFFLPQSQPCEIVTSWMCEQPMWWAVSTSQSLPERAPSWFWFSLTTAEDSSWWLSRSAGRTVAASLPSPPKPSSRARGQRVHYLTTWTQPCPLLRAHSKNMHTYQLKP